MWQQYNISALILVLIFNFIFIKIWHLNFHPASLSYDDRILYEQVIKRLQDVSCFSVLHHALSFVIASCYIVHGLTCSRWQPVKNTFYLIRILCQLAVLPNVNAANNVVLVYTLNVLNPTPYIFVHCIHSNLKSH